MAAFKALNLFLRTLSEVESGGGGGGEHKIRTEKLLTFYSEYINLFRIFILRVASNSLFAYTEFGQRKAKLSMCTRTQRLSQCTTPSL